MSSDDRLGGIGEVSANAVQHRLYSSVFDSRTEENRGEFETDGCATDGFGHLGTRGRLIGKNHVGNFIVDFGELLDEFGTFLLCEIDDRGRDLVGFHDFNAKEI